MDGKDPAFPNGDPVCVTPKVFDGIAKAVEGLLDVRAPVFSVKALCEFRPFIGITQFCTGGRKNKGAVPEQSFEACHIFSPEFIPQHFNRDKELSRREAQLCVFGKPAAGDNAVHMHMI